MRICTWRWGRDIQTGRDGNGIWQNTCLVKNNLGDVQLMYNPKLTPNRLPFKSIGQATPSMDYQSDGLISNDIDCFVGDQSKVLHSKGSPRFGPFTSSIIFMTNREGRLDELLGCENFGFSVDLDLTILVYIGQSNLNIYYFYVIC